MTDDPFLTWLRQQPVGGPLSPEARARIQQAEALARDPERVGISTNEMLRRWADRYPSKAAGKTCPLTINGMPCAQPFGHEEERDPLLANGPGEEIEIPPNESEA